jgi:Zn finger protein HypA/HybF involved in hydrogenase expression
MHEFPEVQAMVKQACAQVPAGSHIKKLRIVVGEASGHDPRHIEAHFAEASRATPAEGAVLEFIHEKLVGTCTRCGAEFTGDGLVLACTQCGGSELTITAGNAVRLAAVET